MEWFMIAFEATLGVAAASVFLFIAFIVVTVLCYSLLAVYDGIRTWCKERWARRKAGYKDSWRGVG